MTCPRRSLLQVRVVSPPTYEYSYYTLGRIHVFRSNFLVNVNATNFFFCLSANNSRACGASVARFVGFLYRRADAEK